METALRRRLFVALLTEDMAALERRTAGECRERLGGEASRVADVVARALTGGVKSCATAVHGVASLTRLSWEISAVALGMVPPGVLLFGVVGAFSAKAHRDAATAKEAAASVAAERLAGARTVRAFAREEAEEARYAEALRIAAAAKSRAIHAHAAHLALFAAVPSTAVAAWLWYGGQLVQQGRLTVGELTTVVPLALEVAGALAGLSELSAEVQRGAHAADNAARVLNAEQKVETRVRRRMEARLDARHRREAPARHDSAPASPASSAVSRRESNESSDDAVVAANRPRGAISFRDVRFAYPGRPEREVLRGFDLDLKPGETFALVGPSGGGKSTVGALLSRFYDPVAGAVFLDGRDIKTLDVSWLRANIGTVSQDVTLFDGTIAETITYASDASDRESRIARADVVAAADVANARGFIEAFPDGYETRVGENGALLSGGQKQRLAIARVILSNPAILLLDEATSALDAQSEASVSEALSRAAEGRTTILVAHRLATARRAPHRRAQRRAAGGVRDARAAHEEDERRVQGARGDATRGDVTKRRTCALRFRVRTSRKVDRVFDEAEFFMRHGQTVFYVVVTGGGDFSRAAAVHALSHAVRPAEANENITSEVERALGTARRRPRWRPRPRRRRRAPRAGSRAWPRASFRAARRTVRVPGPRARPRGVSDHPLLGTVRRRGRPSRGRCSPRRCT